MTSPEQVIWSNEVTEGFFKKRVVETQKITNYRVIQNSAYVGLGLLEDIVVMNQHRVSESNYTSAGGRRGAPRFGTGQSKSRTVGDLAFIYQGKPHIIFRQIYDPQGVTTLAKAARKTFIENKKTAEKMNKARLKEQQQKDRISRTTTAINNKGITCSRCNSTNVRNSKYCNNCGYRLADAANEGIKNQRPPSVVSVSQMSSSNKAEQQSVGEFVTCELRDYGMKIDYPSNWYKSEQGLKPPMIVGFRSPKEHASDTYLETVGIALSTVENMNLEQFMEANINGLKKKHHSTFNLIESVLTVLAGQEAHKIVYKANGKTFLVVATKRGGKIYKIMYVAEPTKFDNYLPIVQKMLDSFEII